MMWLFSLMLQGSLCSSSKTVFGEFQAHYVNNFSYFPQLNVVDIASIVQVYTKTLVNLKSVVIFITL